MLKIEMYYSCKIMLDLELRIGLGLKLGCDDYAIKFGLLIEVIKGDSTKGIID